LWCPIPVIYQTAAQILTHSNPSQFLLFHLFCWQEESNTNVS
jgi:hypothetical protein